jgi:hypothetical protein
VDGAFADWVDRVTAATPEWGDGDSVDWRREGAERLELSFDGPFLVDGAPAGFQDGRPEEDPHLANPAVTLGFGQDRATVSWGGAELVLDIAGALTAAEEVR